MQTLLALGLAAAAAVIVIARPPGPVMTTESQESVLHSPARQYLKDHMLPRFLWPHYFANDAKPRVLQPHRQQPIPDADWLSQEIERLNRLQQRVINPYKSDFSQQIPYKPSYMKRMLIPSPYDLVGRTQSYFIRQPWPAWSMLADPAQQQHGHDINEIVKPAKAPFTVPATKQEKRKEFALTPRDKGFFATTEKDTTYLTNMTAEIIQEGVGQQGLHEGGGQPAIDLELDQGLPRQIRQNPNLSRTKTLVSEDLGKLQAGLGHENLGDKSQNIHMEESAALGSNGSFYGVALISAIGAVVVLAFLGFAFAWYTMSKRAKAAADVDYPAYGVTGPTIDTSGDRKLAQSAHMYHYQHQKQQIIAMERSGMDQRSGSVTDPESEDENEEGDYTVYECPGFATTGDMEVKNPLFNEEPTPATPGKCEVVKPQPKD